MPSTCKVVEAQPRDWNSANALGDLYVRANQLDKGIAQYTRIADHLSGEGFYPKAAALYKKILKFKPDQESALLKSGEVAAKQGLLADAKAAFRTVADRRRAAGDTKGAAEISIRIGTLDPEDLEARLGAAQAAVDIGDTATALNEFREVALGYEKQGNAGLALAAFESAYALDPPPATSGLGSSTATWTPANSIRRAAWPKAPPSSNALSRRWNRRAAPTTCSTSSPRIATNRSERRPGSR